MQHSVARTRATSPLRGMTGSTRLDFSKGLFATFFDERAKGCFTRPSVTPSPHFFARCTPKGGLLPLDRNL